MGWTMGYAYGILMGFNVMSWKIYCIETQKHIPNVGKQIIHGAYGYVGSSVL